MKSGLRQAEINKVVAALRAGESWERARTLLQGICPEAIERFKPLIEQLAAEPGPAEKLPGPITQEEEREQLRKWAEHRLPRLTPPLKVTSPTRGTYTIGGCRR